MLIEININKYNTDYDIQTRNRFELSLELREKKKNFLFLCQQTFEIYYSGIHLEIFFD